MFVPIWMGRGMGSPIPSPKEWIRKGPKVFGGGFNGDNP